eukprot:PhF_6_TR7029/c0_g3_i3/m.10532
MGKRKYSFSQMAELFDDETIEELSCMPSVDALQVYVIWVSLPGMLTKPMPSVYIKSHHRTYCWDVPPNATVHDIQNVMGHTTLDPHTMLMCVFCGQLMYYDMYLADYGVDESNTIMVALRNTRKLNDMLNFTYSPSHVSLFPNEVLLAEDTVVLQFHDDFGVIEPTSKSLCTDNDKMFRITFPRPVVNVTLKTMLDSVECFRYCEIVTTKLNVMYDGVLRIIPYSPPSGQGMRYRLLYSILCAVCQHLKEHTALDSHVTPFMLRLRDADKDTHNLCDESFIAAAGVPNDFVVDVLPYEVSCERENDVCISQTPMRHRGLGMVCVIRARNVIVLGHPKNNAFSNSRGRGIVPVGVLLDDGGREVLDLY